MKNDINNGERSLAGHINEPKHFANNNKQWIYIARFYKKTQTRWMC